MNPPQGARRRPGLPTTPLRERREAIQLTQAQLGELLGICARYVRGIETGRKEVPRWYPLALAEIERREAIQLTQAQPTESEVA